MPESTAYKRRLIANTSTFYLKSGGTWFVEGFKQSATHEWQIAIKWAATGAYIRTRSKISGTWQEWYDIYTSAEVYSKDEVDEMLGDINAVLETLIG